MLSVDAWSRLSKSKKEKTPVGDIPGDELQAEIDRMNVVLARLNGFAPRAEATVKEVIYEVRNVGVLKNQKDQPLANTRVGTVRARIEALKSELGGRNL